MEVGDRVRFSRSWLRRKGFARDPLFLRVRGTVSYIRIEGRGRNQIAVGVEWDEDALDEFLIQALAMAHDKRPKLTVIQGGQSDGRCKNTVGPETGIQ